MQPREQPATYRMDPSPVRLGPLGRLLLRLPMFVFLVVWFGLTVLSAWALCGYELEIRMKRIDPPHSSRH
jgi:hypothetical protein